MADAWLWIDILRTLRLEHNTQNIHTHTRIPEYSLVVMEQWSKRNKFSSEQKNQRNQFYMCLWRKKRNDEKKQLNFT